MADIWIRNNGASSPVGFPAFWDSDIWSYDESSIVAQPGVRPQEDDRIIIDGNPQAGPNVGTPEESHFFNINAGYAVPWVSFRWDWVPANTAEYLFRLEPGASIKIDGWSSSPDDPNADVISNLNTTDETTTIEIAELSQSLIINIGTLIWGRDGQTKTINPGPRVDVYNLAIWRENTTVNAVTVTFRQGAPTPRSYTRSGAGPITGGTAHRLSFRSVDQPITIDAAVAGASMRVTQYDSSNPPVIPAGVGLVNWAYLYQNYNSSTVQRTENWPFQDNVIRAMTINPTWRVTMTADAFARTITFSATSANSLLPPVLDTGGFNLEIQTALNNTIYAIAGFVGTANDVPQYLMNTAGNRVRMIPKVSTFMTMSSTNSNRVYKENSFGFWEFDPVANGEPATDYIYFSNARMGFDLTVKSGLVRFAQTNGDESYVGTVRIESAAGVHSSSNFTGTGSYKIENFYLDDQSIDDLDMEIQGEGAMAGAGSIEDCDFSGGATFVALNAVNVDGNTNVVTGLAEGPAPDNANIRFVSMATASSRPMLTNNGAMQ